MVIGAGLASRSTLQKVPYAGVLVRRRGLRPPDPSMCSTFWRQMRAIGKTLQQDMLLTRKTYYFESRCTSDQVTHRYCRFFETAIIELRMAASSRAWAMARFAAQKAIRY